MIKRALGRSGLQVPPLTFGGNVFGWTVDEAGTFSLLDALLDAGLNFIDTADMYSRWVPGNQGGESETLIGKWLKRTGKRDQVLIATKVGMEMGPGQKGLSPAYIRRSLEASLARLQTDYVDLYQAHRWDYETPIEETMQAFADVVRQGKALYIGVSEWTAEQISTGHALARQLGIQLISSQPQYSMLWRVIEGEVVPTCRELGISQIVWSPVAQGVLTGKYLPGQPAPAGSRGTDAKGGANMIARFLNQEEVLARVQGLRPIADELGLSMAQLAVAWVLQNDNLAAAIIGASRPEQVAENVKASGVEIPAELMRRIDEVRGDVVVRDPALTLEGQPKVRPV